MLKLGNATSTKDRVLVIYDEELEVFEYSQLKDYDKDIQINRRTLAKMIKRNPQFKRKVLDYYHVTQVVLQVGLLKILQIS